MRMRCCIHARLPLRSADIASKSADSFDLIMIGLRLLLAVSIFAFISLTTTTAQPDSGPPAYTTALLVVALIIIIALVVVVVLLACWIIAARRRSSSVKAPLVRNNCMSDDVEVSISKEKKMATAQPNYNASDAPLTNQERSHGYVEASEIDVNIDDHVSYEEISDDENAMKKDSQNKDSQNKDSQNNYYKAGDDDTSMKEGQNGYDQVCDDDTSMKEGQNGYDQVCDEEESNAEEHYVVDNVDPRYNAEPYFKPASKEEEVMTQLKSKLQVSLIPKENLKLLEELGSGEFGTVYRGMWLHTAEDSSELVEEEVAVKTMRGGVTEEDKIKFLQEAANIAQFKHHYVICMKGLIMDPTMIVLELMKGGDLREYLLTTMRKNLKTLDPLESGSTLLSYTKQLALGMYCFARKAYIHRDFAARNVLMSEDGSTCKIADFGLSRSLQDQDYYVSHGGKIPVKWTAPEALLYRKYSVASDVWSFGCVLFEIWSLGEKPFREMTNQQAIKHVVAGNRQPPPPGCPRTVYKIMIDCWHPKAEERPTFCYVMQELQKSDFDILRWSAEEMNAYSQETRKLGSPLELGKEMYKDLQQKYMKIK